MEIACHTEPAATDVFTHVVAPWVDAASARLRDELTALPTTAVDPSALVASCAERLSRRLVRLVTPSLVHELSQMRDHFERYPVLARELDRERDTAVEVTAEIAARYAADQAELTDAVLDAKSALVAVRPEGDRHQGGRATTILELADGQLVVYKPRGVDAHLAFARVVALVNDVTGLDLATVGAVASNGYGWTEHVEPAPLPTADATRYFERLGGLLAVLHLVRATDMHHQNVIARAGQPLLIDVETLFQAQLSVERPDPAADALARSVARTGILPAVAGRYGLADISAVGGDNDESHLHRQPSDVCRSAGRGRRPRRRRPVRVPAGVRRDLPAQRGVRRRTGDMRVGAGAGGAAADASVRGPDRRHPRAGAVA